MLYASVSQLKKIYMYKLFSVKGGDMVGGSETRGTKVHIGRTRNSFQFNNELTEIRGMKTCLSYKIHSHLPEGKC